MKNSFGEWLREQIKKSGNTQVEFSRKIGITQSQLSRMLSGERGTSNETLESIARILRIPIEEIFRKADILPSTQINTEYQERLAYIFDQLPTTEKKMLVDYAGFLLAQIESNNK